MFGISQQVWIVGLCIVGAVLGVVDLARTKLQSLAGFGLIALGLAGILLAK